VEREAHLVGLLAPIRTFITCDALHGVQLLDEIPWPVEPKPPRVAPDVSDDATLVAPDDDEELLLELDDRHQLCPPPWPPDVVLQGCAASCGVPGLTVGACCAHSVRGGAR